MPPQNDTAPSYQDREGDFDSLSHAYWKGDNSVGHWDQPIADAEADLLELVLSDFFPDGGLALDVGSRDYRLAEVCERCGLDVVATDIAPRHPNVIRGNILEYGGGTPGPVNDLVILGRVLSNIDPEKRERALQICYDSLIDGGMLVIFDADQTNRTTLSLARRMMQIPPLPSGMSGRPVEMQVHRKREPLRRMELVRETAVAADYYMWTRYFFPIMHPDGAFPKGKDREPNYPASLRSLESKNVRERRCVQRMWVYKK